MAVESVSDFDDAMGYAAWALETGLWNGRVINPEGVNNFKNELVANIVEKLFSQNPDSFAFQEMALELAYIGCFESDREEYRNKLAALAALQNGIAIPAGFSKSIKKFWKKHKVEILVGIAAVAVVTAVAVGVLCTAAAAGTLAADAAKNKKDPPKPEPLSAEKEDSPVLAPKDQSAIPTKASMSSQMNLSIDKDGFVLNGERFSFDSALNPQVIAPAIQSFGDIQFWKAYELFQIQDPEAFFPKFGKIPDYFNKDLTERNEAESRPLDNYASSVIRGDPTNKPSVEPPFPEIFLIGEESQGTVHFHCGINNNELTVTEGGLKLWETLDQNFAVHPHLIHSDSLIHGLTMVHLEKIDNPRVTLESLRPLTAINSDFELALLPREILKNSLVQRSIDYEVSMLAKIADNIIEKGNPKLKQVHVAFSNGGHVFKEALQQLSPEQQQTVIVVTTGTTAIIDEHLACKVYNVVGSKDWPSIVCNGGIKGIEKAKETANVEMVPQTETEGVVGGHYFLQPDYQDKIKGLFSIGIIGEYEIY